MIRAVIRTCTGVVEVAPVEVVQNFDRAVGDFDGGAGEGGMKTEYECGRKKQGYDFGIKTKYSRGHSTNANKKVEVARRHLSTALGAPEKLFLPWEPFIAKACEPTLFFL